MYHTKEYINDDDSNITETTDVSLFTVENDYYDIDEMFAEDWMEAIMANDLELVSAMLKKVEKSKMLHVKSASNILSKIPSDAKICKGAKRNKRYTINCPWILACCYGARNILKYLHKQKFDLFYQDKDGNNCIHNMIILSADEGMYYIYF